MPATLDIVWTGVDGSVWSLLDPLSPVRLLSVEGLGMPAFTQQWAQSGARDGRRYQGTGWGANDLTLVVQVGDDHVPPGYTSRRRGADWRDIDREFRASLSPEETGTLTVVTEAGRRSVTVQLDAPFSPPAAIDPAWAGQVVYTLEFTAGDSPWWTGELVNAEFDWSTGGQPFFGGNDGQVLFFISPASQTERSTVTNPGDRPSWATWWARGPFDSVTIGIAGRTVTLPFALTNNQLVYVDSQEQTITDAGGHSLWPLMGFANPIFAPIPAGGAVELVTELTGAADGAAVGLSLLPLYEAPW